MQHTVFVFLFKTVFCYRSIIMSPETETREAFYLLLFQMCEKYTFWLILTLPQLKIDVSLGREGLICNHLQERLCGN